MYWDKLPPHRIEDCPYRSSAETGEDGARAVCNLLEIAGIPREQCGVDRKDLRRVFASVSSSTRSLECGHCVPHLHAVH